MRQSFPASTGSQQQHCRWAWGWGRGEDRQGCLVYPKRPVRVRYCPWVIMVHVLGNLTGLMEGLLMGDTNPVFFSLLHIHLLWPACSFSIKSYGVYKGQWGKAKGQWSQLYKDLFCKVCTAFQCMADPYMLWTHPRAPTEEKYHVPQVGETRYSGTCPTGLSCPWLIVFFSLRHSVGVNVKP